MISTAKNNSRRILLVILHPVGGIRSYVKYIYGCDWFDEYDFTVIEPGDGDGSFYQEIFSQRNFEYITCDGTMDMLIKMNAYVCNNDVVLIHSHGFTAGCIATLVARRIGISHIMTGHDMFQKKQFTGFKGWLKRKILANLLKKIDRIHTVSNDATANMLEYFPGVKQENIICIPHGIDADRFFLSDKEVPAIEFDKENTCLIGFFGRFMSPKGFRYLLDAIEIIAERGLVERSPLVLTFDWGGFVREEYEDIERRGLSQFFKMMPFTDNMPGVIKAMELVVMPSVWESSGLLAMEALVAGVPIIGTSCVGLREVLRESPSVMVPPMDAESLAGAIADEMNKPRNKEFKQYSVIARKRFSLHRPSLELKKLYAKLIPD